MKNTVRLFFVIVVILLSLHSCVCIRCQQRVLLTTPFCMLARLSNRSLSLITVLNYQEFRVSKKTAYCFMQFQYPSSQNNLVNICRRIFWIFYCDTTLTPRESGPYRYLIPFYGKTVYYRVTLTSFCMAVSR